MSRKPLQHDLPGLEALHPGFQGFGPRQNALRELTGLLRRTVRQVRGNRTRHFYTQWEVAKFFGVPLRTAALAFQRLGEEGLLSCIRGSATFVHARRLQPRRQPRGVVGLPVWTMGFALLPHWRRFFAGLEEELRREGLVADTVFYRGGEEADPDFGERLLAHHLDCLIWLYPLPRSVPIIERLADGGVRTLAVVEPPALPSASFRQYPIVWDRAYRDAMRYWQREGVREAVVVAPGAERSRDAQPIREALAEVGMRARFQDFLELEKMPVGNDGGTGIVFGDEWSQLAAWSAAPKAMARLMGEVPILVKNSLATLQVPEGAQVDLVTAEWEKLARRLAHDVAEPSPETASRPKVTQARFVPRIAAQEISEKL